MNIDQRLKAFATLGDYIKNIGQEEMQTLTWETRNQNPWFTPASVEMALSAIGELLDEDSLKKWVKNYDLSSASKRVALVLAGNIPMVGFHDLLSVLMSGHSALLKLSSKDQFLITSLINKLTEIEPAFSNKIELVERLKDFDAVIATGSDNSARYFEYYFAKYPHIIRKNRTSVGIITGKETEADLRALGKDVFSYFGLGCRNVSKLFVPDYYKFDRLFESWEVYADIINHHKYCNNYDYQKSILLVNRQDFLDNGFVIIQHSDKIVSPISVVYYDYYEDEIHLQERLNEIKDKTQVVVGGSPFAQVAFGNAQCPGLNDYADKIDTMKFLAELK
jgi:hypothetical protein